MTQSELRQAYANYTDKLEFGTLAEFFFLRDEEKDILKIRNAFKIKYDFEISDLYVADIWIWHSSDQCATWLIVDDTDEALMFFEEFVKEYLNRSI